MVVVGAAVARHQDQEVVEDSCSAPGPEDAPTHSAVERTSYRAEDEVEPEQAATRPPVYSSSLVICCKGYSYNSLVLF